jgi:hypothetical protein
VVEREVAERQVVERERVEREVVETEVVERERLERVEERAAVGWEPATASSMENWSMVPASIQWVPAWVTGWVLSYWVPALKETRYWVPTEERRWLAGRPRRAVTVALRC